MAKNHLTTQKGATVTPSTEHFCYSGITSWKIDTVEPPSPPSKCATAPPNLGCATVRPLPLVNVLQCPFSGEVAVGFLMVNLNLIIFEGGRFERATSSNTTKPTKLFILIYGTKCLPPYKRYRVVSTLSINKGIVPLPPIIESFFRVESPLS